MGISKYKVLTREADLGGLSTTVQYKGSEKKIVFWADSAIKWWFRLNFMIEIGKKHFDDLYRPKKGQNKAWKVGDSSFLLSKSRKKFQEKQQESTMYS